MAGRGLPALPTYVPLAEGPDNRELAMRFPLQCIVPPNRFFLNSSFSQSERLRRRQGAATAMLAPADAATRGITDGDTVRVERSRTQRGPASLSSRGSGGTASSPVAAASTCSRVIA
jgi:anaerobic selenocysteine-containing dehydrogenase